METPAEAFLRESSRYLRDVHLPRIERALGALRRDDIWWRPHRGTTAVGNLLLHLEGNVHQWILAGLGGAPDTRERSAEFAASAGPGKEDLLERLRVAVVAACEVIEGLERGRLGEPLEIQGMATTPLAAVFHVVEHFSWHTAQVVWIAKARGGPGHGIAFFDDSKLDVRRED